MKLHKDLDCYPQVWQDVATAYYVSSATSLRAQDAHAQQNSIAQRASFGNALETQVELTRSAPRLPGPLSPQQRPPCFGMVAVKKMARSAQSASSSRSNQENCQWTLSVGEEENVHV